MRLMHLIGWSLAFLASPGLIVTLSRAAYASPVPSAVDRLKDLLKRRPFEGGQLDLDYQSVSSLAIRQNLRLRFSQLQVEAAEARYEQAVAERNPTVSVYASYRQKAPDVVRGLLPDRSFIPVAEAAGLNAADLYTTGQNQMFNRATLYVPVYTGGLLESRIHNQAALTRVEKFGLQRTRQLIAFEAKQQYLMVLLAQENVRVAEQSQAQANETARFARDRLQAGVANRYDLMQAEVAVANAEDAVVRTKSSVQKARADLAIIVDVPILTDFVLRDVLTGPYLLKFEPLGDISADHLAQVALSQRPELEQMMMRLVSNRELKNVANAGLLPKLLVNLNYDLVGSTVALRGGMSLITSLLVPIFDGGVSNARKEENRYQAIQLQTDDLGLAESIVLEALQASLDCTEADERVQTALVAEARATEALRIASLRFQVGAGSSLELVTAQTVLFNARFALADAHYRQMIARASLALALGQPVQGDTE